MSTLCPHTTPQGPHFLIFWDRNETKPFSTAKSTYYSPILKKFSPKNNTKKQN